MRLGAEHRTLAALTRAQASISTVRQEAIVEAGVHWAERDRRVRALLLKGSLARGEA